MENRISQSDINEIEIISQKIDKNKAVLEDYEKYESLLLQAGIEKDEITGSMRRYGFQNYKEYLEAREKPLNKEENKVVNVRIVAALVVMSAIISLYIAYGKILVSDEKEYSLNPSY